MSTREEFDVEAARIAGLIGTARRRVAARETVDLQDLPDQVARLCELAVTAPEEDRPDLRAALDELLGELDALTEDLTAVADLAGPDEAPTGKE